MAPEDIKAQRQLLFVNMGMPMITLIILWSVDTGFGVKCLYILPMMVELNLIFVTLYSLENKKLSALTCCSITSIRFSAYWLFV